MEAGNFKVGLHKPTFHEMACKQLVRCGDSFKAGLHKPTFREMAFKQLAKFGDSLKDGLQGRALCKDCMRAADASEAKAFQDAQLD